jgi:hypothetical protein
VRAANRSHAPSFFDSNEVGAETENEPGLLSGTRTRARRQYRDDEHRDVDDMEWIDCLSSVVICFLGLWRRMYCLVRAALDEETRNFHDSM